MLRNNNNDFDHLQNLSLEILFKIFSYLSPENIRTISLINQPFNHTIEQANFFWREKFERHFPHVFRKLMDKENKENFWYQEFRKTYEDEYKHSPTSDRAIFSLLKENNNSELKEKLETYPDIRSIVEIQDDYGRSLLDWARQIKNQDILDYFYERIQKKYESPNHEIDVRQYKSGYFIFEWAIVCNQSTEKLESLVQQGNKNNETDHFDTKKYIPFAVKQDRVDVVVWLLEKNFKEGLYYEECFFPEPGGLLNIF